MSMQTPFHKGFEVALLTCVTSLAGVQPGTCLKSTICRLWTWAYQHCLKGRWKTLNPSECLGWLVMTGPIKKVLRNWHCTPSKMIPKHCFIATDASSINYIWLLQNNSREFQDSSDQSCHVNFGFFTQTQIVAPLHGSTDQLHQICEIYWRMGIVVLVLLTQKHPLYFNFMYVWFKRLHCTHDFFVGRFWHNGTMPFPFDQDIIVISQRSQTFGDLQGLLTRSAKLSFSCTGKIEPRQQCPDYRPAHYGGAGGPSPLLSFSCWLQGQTFFQNHLLWWLVWYNMESGSQWKKCIFICTIHVMDAGYRIWLWNFKTIIYLSFYHMYCILGTCYT